MPRPGSPRPRWFRTRRRLGERVALVHERFHQPAIAEEFVDGRELYVSLIGNGDALRRPADHRDGLRQATRPAPRSGSPPSPPSGTRSYRARQRDPQRLRPAALQGRARADRGRSAAPRSGRSGCATMPGSTSGSRPTARSGSSRPTPTPSSATATTWRTRRRRRGWTTTSSSSGWWTRRWRAMSRA